MTTNVKVINGFVDIIGDSGQKAIDCIVDIVEDLSVREILNGDINNIKAITGNLIDEVGNAIPGARISFIKDKVTVDYCVTDLNGKYSIFVPSDKYTIKIDSDKYNEIHQDKEISGGLTEYYYTIDGFIKRKFNNNDIIEFIGTNKRLISGIMLDKDHHPLSNTEIIISSGDDVKTYFITGKDGKYSFAIENGIYDVRIRTKDRPVRIIKNFKFEDGKGFFSELKGTYNIFGGGGWIWIYQ